MKWAVSRQWFALSEHPFARAARRVRRTFITFTLPAPALIVRPLLAIFIALRACYYFAVRVFVCEPLFKAYCTRYGRRVRTGTYIHWVTGSGKLILGDDVWVDGKCSFVFAVRYVKDPLLAIGSNTIIGHECSFTVGRQITIGKHCLIAEGVHMFDAPGHPTDPALRKAGAPASPEYVRPIEIKDNVWIGRNAIVFPGVTVGEGSVVAAGSLVTASVPPYTIVAGNPARVIGRLGDQSSAEQVIETAPETSCASLNAVMAILRRVLGSNELTPDEDFYHAGVTSIMLLPLLVEMEQQFGLSIAENKFLNARTGEELAALIDSVLADRPVDSDRAAIQ